MNTRLTILALLLAASVLSAGERTLECDSFDYRMGKCYFPVGVEADVYSGCPFVVLCDEDTLVSGTLEAAYEGISWTATLADSLHGFFADHRCRAIVAPALADSTSTILIGAVGEDLAAHLMDVTGRQTNAGNPLELAILSPYDDAWALLASDSIQAVLSYRSMGGRCSNQHELTSPAPWIAVMLPNLSRPLNRDGLLTTALYYRFDPRLLEYLFDSDSAAAVNAWSGGESTPRPYPHDPDDSRRLLRQLPHDMPVRIAIGHSDLKRLAEYFADILARHRFDVRFVDSYAEADLWLGWLAAPVRSDSDGIASAYRLISESRPLSRAQEEAMALLGSCLQQIEAGADSTTVAGLLPLAKQTLVTDLGAFSLFRPRLHLISDWPQTGIGFDTRGHLQYDSMRLLRLPDSVGTGGGE